MCFFIQKRFDSPLSLKKTLFTSLSEVQQEVRERFSGLNSQTGLLLHWLHPSLLTPSLSLSILNFLSSFPFLCVFCQFNLSTGHWFQSQNPRGLTEENGWIRRRFWFCFCKDSSAKLLHVRSVWLGRQMIVCLKGKKICEESFTGQLRRCGMKAQ